MCGIFAVTQSNNAAQTILEGLKKLEYRGYDSWGIAIKHGNKIKLERHTGKIGSATTTLPHSSIGLGHTRWATHGGVTVANAHPHLDCVGAIALVHNGIIENYQQLKQSLSSRHQFKSQTDTEVLVHLVEELSKKHPFPTAVRLAFKQTQGLNACIFFSAAANQLIAIKNGSPLVIGLSDQGNLIASDSASLSSHTNKVIFLPDNHQAIITATSVKIFDLHGHRQKPEISTLTFQYQDTTLKHHPHYMIKEISEQPQILTHLSQHFPSKAKPLISQINQHDHLLFSGCGTAGYAALLGQYFFSTIANQLSTAIAGSELPHFLHLIDKNTLPILISQSGETIDIIEPLKQLQARHIHSAAIVNAIGSTLYRLADTKVTLDAGPEICVVSTKVFTAKLATLFLLASSLAAKLQSAQQQLQSAINSTSTIISSSYQQQHLKPLIPRLAKANHIYTLGRGFSYPIALEAALKIKEISYIHAEGFAAGELKHGVIALIEKGTPTIFFAPHDKTFDDTVSGATEVKARGGYIIGISPKNHQVFDHHLPIPDSGPITAIPNTVIAQLLGYHLAIKLELDPDKPRNLAKSVTVK